MAIWQFDFYLIPRKAIERVHGPSPVVLGAFRRSRVQEADSYPDPPNYWAGRQCSSYENAVGASLAARKSWAPEAPMFGDEKAVRSAYLDGETDGPRSYAATAWVVRGTGHRWTVCGARRTFAGMSALGAKRTLCRLPMSAKRQTRLEPLGFGGPFCDWTAAVRQRQHAAAENRRRRIRGLCSYGSTF